MKLPKIVQNIAKKVDEEINEVKDPVCGTKVNLEKTKYKQSLNPQRLEFKSTYKGKEYGFCSENCKAGFDKNPHQYAEANY
ncbi:YHS domain-containing protein [Candidatus Daviesbacteria bacterium]|nr:YHS domain-containing protein [Candidatus Daviesbacteria bacterium]